MDKPLIMLDSLTYAIKSKEILFQNGISSYVERTSGAGGSIGCGYGLYIPNRIDEAIDILKEKNINIVRTVRRDGDSDIS